MPEPLEPGSQVKLVRDGRPLVAQTQCSPAGASSSLSPAACLVLHHVQDSFKVSCAMVGGGGGTQNHLWDIAGACDH